MTVAQEKIIELLDEPGSRTKESLVAELDGEVDSTEVTRALGELLVSGEVEEHPEIAGAYRLAEEG